MKKLVIDRSNLAVGTLHDALTGRSCAIGQYLVQCGVPPQAILDRIGSIADIHRFIDAIPEEAGWLFIDEDGDAAPSPEAVTIMRANDTGWDEPMIEAVFKSRGYDVEFVGELRLERQPSR
jgi:hypothetical protein